MKVVKITRDEDGEKIDHPKWCWFYNTGGSDNTLCTGQVFGYGEGSAEYKMKEGKITCPDCIAIIREIKAIKL